MPAHNQRQPGAVLRLSTARAVLLSERLQVEFMRFFVRLFVFSFAVLLLFAANARTQSVQPGQNIGVLPAINAGGGDAVLSGIQAFDFALNQIETIERDRKQQAEQEAKRQQMIKDGIVSALDLAAPPSALTQFNKAIPLLQQQHTHEAITYLEKAVATYPKFVSAHNNLGTAYLELGDDGRARTEFETAAKLDDKFPTSFLNVARLDIAQQNFGAAEKHLDKVISMKPRDANVLTVLAYVQASAHNYHHAIETAERVHRLDHKDYANVHYIAGSAAVSLRDYRVAEREFGLLVQEDPHNPMAPIATQNLKILAKYKNGEPQPAIGGGPAALTSLVSGQQAQTFPDSEHLRSELASLGTEGDEECRDCAVTPSGPVAPPPAPEVPRTPGSAITIRKTVDEVAVFFTATKHGDYVNDLQSSDIQLRDDNKAPDAILQFAPQAKLPMRLGLVIDTSGSVDQRFPFEKKAAIRFLQGMLTNPADLAFVMGFSNGHNVTQEFTSSQEQLAAGVEKLINGGGTSLFDAISYACQKLAAYPDRNRVARVLVVLTDGEDNSSKTSLRRAIQIAAAGGVTIYAISTKEVTGKNGDYGQPTTTADHILQALADRTGGEALFPGQITLLGHRFDKLHDIIRNRYLIAYRPANFQPDGKYRQIAITASKGGQSLSIRARKGYYANGGAASMADPK